MFVSYHLSRKDMFAPSFIICSVFTLSSLFVVMNGDDWGYSISGEATLYLLIAILVTILSISIGTRIKVNTKVEVETDCECISGDISNRWMVVLSAISIAIVYAYFRHQLALSVTLGNGSGLTGMIYTIRMHVYESDNFQLGLALNIGIAFLRAVGFVSVFFFMHQLIVIKRIQWRYVLPMLSLILYFILTGGRSGFITLICAVMYDSYYCFKQIGKKIRPAKTVLYIVIGLVIFLFLFWQLGKLTGKNTVLSLWDTLSIYIGSSILCFDAYMNQTNSYNLIGTNTFKGIYNMLARFGLQVDTIGNHADKIRWNGYSSNIFTAFYAYYSDYGPLFSLIVVSIAGLLIGVLWGSFREGKGDFILAVLYGRFVAYAVAMYSIAERFFSENLALNTILEMIFVFFIIEIFVHKQNLITVDATNTNKDF